MIRGFEHYLDLFFSTVGHDRKLSPDLDRQLRIRKQEMSNGTIDELTFEQLVLALINELDEHMFIWKALAKLKSSHFIKRGPSFMALVTAPDVKTCIQDIVKYQHLLLPESYQLRFHTEQDRVILDVTEHGFASPLPHIKYDTAMGFTLFILRELTNDAFDFDEIYFTKDRPNFDTSIVSKVSNAKIIANSANAKAVFSKRWLNYSNNFYDKNFRAQILQQLEAQNQRQKNEHSITSLVSRIIERAEKPAAVTLDIAAEQLGKSTSTLRRHLGEEKTSFKLLQSKILDELCLDLLLTSDIKIDALALRLGYAERSTFERAFRNKFGTTPAKFRDYRGRLDSEKSEKSIDQIINGLPPLSHSCMELIRKADDNNLDIDAVVSILEQDPVFSGRIMGLASKAIYGTAPATLAQAVGRNLGIETVMNLAVLYSAQESLEQYITGVDIERLIQSASLTPRVFKVLSKNIAGLEYENEVVGQCLMFASLGLLVLCHKNFTPSKNIVELINGDNDFEQLLTRIRSEHNFSVIATSVLLLSFWGINNNVIKMMNQLDAKMASNKPLDKLEALVLLSFATAYNLIHHKGSIDELLNHAEHIGIRHFIDKVELIKEQL